MTEKIVEEICMALMACTTMWVLYKMFKAMR